MEHTPARTNGTRTTMGRIIAVFGALFLGVAVAGVAAGIVLVRSLHPPADRSELRTTLLNALEVERRSSIEITLPAWSMALGRIGASVAELDPEVHAVLETLHSGQLGIYQLARAPQRRQILALLRTADSALEAEGWTRAVAVMEENATVAVYLPSPDEHESLSVEALVIAQDRRDLVIVSARGNTAPLLQLARHVLKDAGPAALHF